MRYFILNQIAAASADRFNFRQKIDKVMLVLCACNRTLFEFVLTLLSIIDVNLQAGYTLYVMPFIPHTWKLIPIEYFYFIFAFNQDGAVVGFCIVLTRFGRNTYRITCPEHFRAWPFTWWHLFRLNSPFRPVFSKLFPCQIIELFIIDLNFRIYSVLHSD